MLAPMRKQLPGFLAGMLAGAVLAYLYGVGSAGRSGPKKVELSIADGGVYRVRRVIDGDTVVLENGLHVRYAGINAPESGRWVKDPAPFAPEATARNKALVENRDVRLALAAAPLDPYGRVVARLKVLPDPPGAGETEVEEVLLKEGLAKFMGLGLDAAEATTLKALESEAREAQRGLWGAAPPTAETFPFCAASSGQVIHRAACAIAKRISPANFQGYKTYAEALATGRRPCSQCLKEPPTP